MYYFHTSIGGGVTGTETIISAINNIEKILKKTNKTKPLKNQKVFFAIIDKNFKNVPGGVAYSESNARYGFFNNPIRLSPKEFTNWLLKVQNKKLVINYLKKSGGFSGKIWLKANEKIFLSNKKKEIDELYMPRASLDFWLQERLYNLTKKIKKLKTSSKIDIDLHFLNGDVINIENIKKNYKKIIFKNNKYEKLIYKFENEDRPKLILNRDKITNEPVYSISQNIGLGLPPPKQLATPLAKKNKNYIWDFYAEGSTSILIKRIKSLYKNKKLVIYFIGYKAGLLESLPELRSVIINNKIKMLIICSSNKLKSIQKAKLSINKKKYQLLVLTNKNIKKIDTSIKLYSAILKEFEIAKTKGYKKYDAWTIILKNRIINKCLKKFDNAEKIKYFNTYHHKIRNITRFTYSKTIEAREKLSSSGILITKKETVKKVDFKNRKLIVLAKNTRGSYKKYNCDIVVNVSGPLNVAKISNEISLISSIKKMGANFSDVGFFVDKNFQINGLNKIYSPSVISRGFNPGRETIINAILKNSKTIGKNIAINFKNNINIT